MSKYLVTFLSITLAIISLAAVAVRADEGCTNGQYGSNCPQPTNLTIDKDVQNPINGEYQENVLDAIFSANTGVDANKVNYRLAITNSSGETMKPVTVIDNVPDNIEITDVFVKDKAPEDAVTFDKKSMTVVIHEMPAGQSREVFIMAKVVGPVPTEDPFCRDNWASVTSPQRPNGDKNFARICVTNKVLGATTLPTAGAEDLLVILPFALTGIGGLALLRKNK